MGLLVAALPLLVVFIVSRLPIAPAVRATVVPAVALLVFLAEWALFSWQSLRDGGWEFGLAAVVLFPFLVAATVLRARAHRAAVAQVAPQPASVAGRPRGPAVAAHAGVREGVGGAMTEESVALLIVVWIPLLVVWAVVIIDVIRRQDLRPTAKAFWAAICTVLWPALIVYLMLRPTRGRLEDPERRDDPQARLVDAALRHESGAIDDAQLASIVFGNG